MRAMLGDYFAGRHGPIKNDQHGLASAYIAVNGWRCYFGTGGGGGCSRGNVKISYQQLSG